MEELLLITLALFTGIIIARIVSFVKLPNVTAYLIAGVIIGPAILGKLNIKYIGFANIEQVKNLSLISDVALGFIAFANGHEFKIENIKSRGNQVFIIGALQGIITTICVDAVLIIISTLFPNVFTLPMAICLGAIAAATAPAATIMVVKQYRAKGPVTDVLLPVVAINDAVGLVIFSVSFGIAGAIINGSVNIINIITEPVLEISFSLLLGALVALILIYLIKNVNSESSKLILIIASIILIVSVAKNSFKIAQFSFSFSPLLSCMMFGAVFCNLYSYSNNLMEETYKWSQPILVLFFVLSGAELNLSVFKNVIVVMIGIVYVLVRIFGKYFGAKLSSRVAHSNEAIRKYLGIALLPQAGVALGMSAIVANSLGTNGILVRNITLFGVLIYELIGPTFTKIALTKAGEISEVEK